jgi:hypothetical protein
MLQSVFEQIRQRHEAIERLLCRDELDKDINITIGASLIAKHGSEERQPANTETPNSDSMPRRRWIASSRVRGIVLLCRTYTKAPTDSRRKGLM